MNLRQRWNQTALHNKALVLCSILMAFGTLFYAAAAVVQIHLLDRSSEESSLQTDQLIIAAKINALATKDNAAAAQSFAASAQKINEGIGDAVIKLQAQADAMETARRSTDTGAQNALQAAIDNFHQEQRAWVGIDIIPAPIDPKAGGIINQASVTVVAHNSGRTPALGVNISWEMAEDSYGFTDEVPDYDEMMAAKKPRGTQCLLKRGNHESLAIPQMRLGLERSMKRNSTTGLNGRKRRMS